MTVDDVRARLIAKVAHLLRLAEDHRTPQYEAEAAMAKAQALMTEHQISSATIDDMEDPDQIGTYRYKTDDQVMWQRILYARVARLNGCVAHFVRGSRTIVVYGKPSDTDFVHRLTQSVIAQIKRLSIDWSWREFRKQDYSAKLSYCLGTATGVYDRLKAAQEEAASHMVGGTAIVLTRTKAVEEYVRSNVVSGRSKYSATSLRAYKRGYNDAGKVKLAEEIEQK
jgi:hypothetical protein